LEKIIEDCNTYNDKITCPDLRQEFVLIAGAFTELYEKCNKKIINRDIMIRQLQGEKIS